MRDGWGMEIGQDRLLHPHALHDTYITVSPAPTSKKRQTWSVIQKEEEALFQFQPRRCRQIRLHSHSN